MKRKFGSLLGALVLLISALTMAGCPKTAVSPQGQTGYAVSFGVEGEPAHGVLTAKIGEKELKNNERAPLGATVVFTARPNGGFKVKEWKVDGKTVDGTENTYSLKISKAVDVKVNFKAQSAGTVQYKVEHWQQNVTGNEYTKIETENKTGVTGVMTEAQAKTYTGFRSLGIVQKPIAADGLTVVQIKYDRNLITLTLNLDGGVLTPPLPENKLKGRFGADVPAAANPTKAGYAFSVWNPELPKKFPAEDKTYTAQWAKEADYTITYHLDGDSYNSNPASYNEETATITLNPAIKIGYDFVGWYDNAACSGSPVTHIVKGSTGNKEFWPKWKARSYTITYHLNGGENAAGNPANYTIETETIILNPAVKTGYTFVGWYDNAACIGYPVMHIAKGNKDNKAFWAKWEAHSYTITYHLNNGSNPADNPENYTIETETITLQDASKANYTFAGWYDNASCSGSPVTHIGKGSTGNKTFWAKWEVITYSIAYNLNGGSHSGNPVSYNVETETITLQDASKANYTFAGWYDNAGFTGGKVTQIAKGSSGNKEFWAKWEAIAYTIKYHLDGGTNNNGNPATYTVETETILLKAAERTGATFMGWYENEGYTGSAVSEITKGSTGNKEFWAKWRINEYAVTFSVDGTPANGTIKAEVDGSEIHTNNKVKYGKTVTFTATPTSSEYVIGLWEVTPKRALIRNGQAGDNTVTVKITAETEVKVRFVRGKTYIVEGVSFTMKDIAAVTDGILGHDDYSNNSNAVHTVVSLTAYRIGETEVTQELWEKVMGKNPSNFQGWKKHPVENINWYHAIAFCNKLSLKLGLTPCYTLTILGNPVNFETLAFSEIPTSYNADWNNTVLDMSKNGFRLPTEAEWEWAAKGGTEDKWAGTNDEDKLKDYAWYESNSGYETHQVKMKEPNGYGLYDMSGNVAEWCWDLLGILPNPLPADYVGTYHIWDYHVFRGGGLTYSREVSRAYRDAKDPGTRGYTLGLRLVLRP